ncbi:CHAD domain-containing protein [Crocosphaera sp. XPORK-15E]|uniref:CHAD domain-containing protein n=1 Tax=Crocosphaera sp. XPORK-15E TaxID=3110247 RepID=UPI002B1F7EA0|nr:CHAD domain-containing protein [Crocosphaera sp. XPORK-15E]MEA5534851.1 CHAD domain-containing protein [Crocosphaera sp. XPORK-15E]
MTKYLEHEPKTFGDWAYVAIAKHYHKFIKYELAVLEDKDPEELHQMRVGMRRLRSAIKGFNSALDLPKNAQEKKVGKVAQVLGSLRDIDVLEDTLKNKYYPNLPTEEQTHLDQALLTLAKQRKKAFKTVQNLLNSKHYLKLKESFEQWLNQPTYNDIAPISIHTILADLLLPQVSQFMLHSGWFLGVKFGEGETFLSDGLSQEEVETLLTKQGLILHDLRKEAKRTRYNMELFTQFYGDMYENYLTDVKDIQTVLGDIQDSFVLAEFLDTVFKDNIMETMPIFSQNLRESRYQKWQEWETLQRKFLRAKTRKDFHITVLQPEIIKPEIEASQNKLEEKTEKVHPIDSSFTA